MKILDKSDFHLKIDTIGGKMNLKDLENAIKLCQTEKPIISGYYISKEDCEILMNRADISKATGFLGFVGLKIIITDLAVSGHPLPFDINGDLIPIDVSHETNNLIQ